MNAWPFVKSLKFILLVPRLSFLAQHCPSLFSHIQEHYLRTAYFFGSLNSFSLTKGGKNRHGLWKFLYYTFRMKTLFSWLKEFQLFTCGWGSKIACVSLKMIWGGLSSLDCPPPPNEPGPWNWVPLSSPPPQTFIL